MIQEVALSVLTLGTIGELDEPNFSGNLRYSSWGSESEEPIESVHRSTIEQI